MSEYLIALDGCDDTQYLKLTMSVPQRMFLERIAERLREENVRGDCQPSLRVMAWDDPICHQYRDSYEDDQETLRERRMSDDDD